jgi:orotate phosphoribosyltransferase
MILNKFTAEKTAQFLLQINAIKLNSKNPFTWASGWKSPIYCDNRLILSFPAIRNFITESFSKQIEENFGKPDVIAGVATGAIGIGALVADYMSLPFIYVRPEPKKHGRQNQIEGFYQKGQKVVVIEDLISTGGSSLQAVEALRSGELDIRGMMAIFTYNFDVSRENFAKNKIDLFTLCNYDILIEEAIKSKHISESELETLKDWQNNPSIWNN